MSPGLGLSHPNHNCCVQDHFICAQVAPYPFSGLPCNPHVTVPEKISVRSVQIGIGKHVATVIPKEQNIPTHSS